MATNRHVSPERKAASRAKSNANLRPIPINERSPEERKEICRKGRRGQQEAQKKRKAIREICDEVLAMTCPQGTANFGALQQAALDAAKQRGEEWSVYEAGVIAQVAKMIEGDTRAAEFVRDSAGDRPGQEVQVSGELTGADLALLQKVAARLDHDKGKAGE